MLMDELHSKHAQMHLEMDVGIDDHSARLTMGTANRDQACAGGRAFQPLARSPCPFLCTGRRARFTIFSPEVYDVEGEQVCFVPAVPLGSFWLRR